MKISRVLLHPLSIPLARPFRISLGEIRASSGVLVRLQTDVGLEGQGEAAPITVISGEDQGTCLAVARLIAPFLLGRDPRAVQERMREVDSAFPGNPAIKAAFDMALWDLAAQAADLPLHRLLGGEGRPVETDRTVGISSIEDMQRSAVAWRKQGFSAIKLKVGGPDLDLEIAKVAAIRAALGPSIRLRADANQGWTVPSAIRAIGAMSDLDLEFVEQPVRRDDLEGLRMVRRSVRVPIMADEACFSPADALRLIRMEAADYLNIKLMKCGGITAALRIAAIAETAGVRCMVGCMVESRLAISAAVHFASAAHAVAFADLDGHVDFATDPTLGGAFGEGELLRPSEEPGLGVRFDARFLGGLETIAIA